MYTQSNSDNTTCMEVAYIYINLQFYTELCLIIAPWVKRIRKYGDN